MATVDRDHLLASAKDFADRALRAYSEDDRKMILFYAAISLEHLCKAYLYSMDPALLVELKPANLDSLLHLTGHGSKAKKLQSPRTISAREAVTRIEYVMPGLTVPKDRITQLIDVRDGVVHVGYLHETETREILTTFLRLSNELYESLKVEPDDRWGTHTEHVASLISDSLSLIEKDVHHRMSAAKLRLGRWLSQIPEVDRDSVMANRQTRVVVRLSDREDSTSVTCPVCGHGGATCIGLPDEVVDYDIERLSGGEYSYSPSAVWPILRVERFICGVCELKLDTPDQLSAAGLEIEIDMSDPDREFIDEGPWTLD